MPLCCPAVPRVRRPRGARAWARPPSRTPGPGQVRIAVKAASVNGIDWKIRVRDDGRRQAAGRRRATSAGTRRAWSTRSARASPGWRRRRRVRQRQEHPGRVRGAGRLGGQAAVGGLDAWRRRPAWPSRPRSGSCGCSASRRATRCSSTAGPAASVRSASQIAIARGATVIASASQDNQDYLREIGATPVLYGEGVVDRVRAVPGGPDRRRPGRGRQDADRGPDRPRARAVPGRHDRQLRRRRGAGARVTGGRRGQPSR